MRYKEIIRENHDVSGNLEDCETPEAIQEMLEFMDAQQVDFKNGQPSIYIVGDQVVEWDGKDIYPEVENINQWIWDANLNTYYPSYEDRFNREFWKYPQALFHATTEENVEKIKHQGLMMQNQTRGIGNRSVGGAVFTTSNYEEALGGSYGEFIFEIDTAAMAANGDKPYVAQEPPIVEAELRRALAHYIGLEDFESEEESGMSPDTIIVFGPIKPEYLTLED